MGSVSLESFGSGGAALNFKVVGGTTQPAKPSENTIWVNTNKTIHAWAFAAEQPYKVSKNKNLLTYPYYHTTKTDCGITFTDNGDGTVTANGTATDLARFRPSHKDAQSGLIWLPPGTYTMSGGAGMGTYAQCYDHVNDKTLANSADSAVTFTLQEGTFVRFSLLVQSGTTLSNKIFKPQLEVGATATSFVKGDASGQIWIKAGTYSPVEFNALKKNAVYVYPLSAYQYSNEWAKVDAEIYQGGEWVEWITYLFNYGAMGYEWSILNKKVSGASDAKVGNVAITKNSDGSMSITESVSYGAGMAYISEAIDLTNYSTIEFYGTLYSPVNEEYRTSLCVWSSVDGTYTTDNVVARSSEIDLVNSKMHVDVSSLIGTYYVGFSIHHNQSYITVNAIALL